MTRRQLISSITDSIQELLSKKQSGVPLKAAPAPMTTAPANTKMTMTELTKSDRQRIEELEDAVKLLLASTKAYAPGVVEDYGHGTGNSLVRQVTVEQVEYLRRVAETEKDLLEKRVAEKAIEIDHLKIRKEEIEHGLI